MKADIGKRHQITSDGKQFILHRKALEGVSWTVIGYYPTMYALLRDAMWSELKATDHETWNIAYLAVKQLADDLVDALKIQISIENSFEDIPKNLDKFVKK